MNIAIYVISLLFTLIMWINGAVRYWGCFDKESMEAIFYHYMASKREERNWKLAQKIYGKNLMIAGGLNVLTQVVLIPMVNSFADRTEQTEVASYGLLLIMFLPSLVYMFGARLLMELRLKQLEDTES